METPEPTPILVQIVGDNAAPWWGDTAINGAFLVLGAVLAFVFNLIQQRSQSERKSRTRWDERIAEQSAIYIQKAEELVGLGGNATAGNIATKRIGKLENEIQNLASLLSLIVSKKLRNSVGDVSVSAYLISASRDPLELDQLSKELAKATRRYDQAVRKQFGL